MSDPASSFGRQLARILSRKEISIPRLAVVMGYKNQGQEVMLKEEDY